MKRTFLTALLLTAAMTTSVHAASFKLIVNSGVRIDSLSKKAASDLFLKKTSRWDNGTNVVPVDQVDSTGVREQFSKAVHNKATAAVKSYWNQQIFSGREVPPVEKKTDAEVLAFVRSTPGAVGYVSEEATTDGVRVVTVN